MDNISPSGNFRNLISKNPTTSITASININKFIESDEFLHKGDYEQFTRLLTRISSPSSMNAIYSIKIIRKLLSDTAFTKIRDKFMNVDILVFCMECMQNKLSLTSTLATNLFQIFLYQIKGIGEEKQWEKIILHNRKKLISLFELRKNKQLDTEIKFEAMIEILKSERLIILEKEFSTLGERTEKYHSIPSENNESFSREIISTGEELFTITGNISEEFSFLAPVINTLSRRNLIPMIKSSIYINRFIETDEFLLHGNYEEFTTLLTGIPMSNLIGISETLKIISKLLFATTFSEIRDNFVNVDILIFCMECMHNEIVFTPIEILTFKIFKFFLCQCVVNHQFKGIGELKKWEKNILKNRGELIDLFESVIKHQKKAQINTMKYLNTTIPDTLDKNELEGIIKILRSEKFINLEKLLQELQKAVPAKT